MSNWTDKKISNLKSQKIDNFHIIHEKELRNVIRQTQKTTAFAVQKRENNRKNSK